MPARTTWDEPAAGWIERPRLVALSRPRAGDIRLVVAPAGSGKSVLLAQATSGLDVAWLTLTDAHNDAVVLTRDLVTTLAPDDEPGDASLNALVPTGGRRFGPELVGAIRALVDEHDGRVIVLDDLHAVTNHELLEDLERALVTPPRRHALLVASRWDPPFRLGRLRLDGVLTELRAADLAFEEDEAGRLIERVAGQEIGAPQIRSLVSRTEGWAAGLQLASVSLQRRTDVDAFVAGFAGEDRLIGDYLTSEVLESQSDEVRRFLLRTSVLDWLEPELCDAVTGDGNARAMLSTLEDRGLFVTPVTGQRSRWRYHQLFAELLRYQLQADDPAEVEAARRRAAAWLLDAGEIRGAVEQLLAAGDAEAAFGVIERHGLSFFERGEIATLARWLAAIERSGGASGPGASICLLAAQVAADDVVAALTTHRRIEAVDLQPGEQVAVDALMAALGQGDRPAADMRRHAARANAALATIDRSTVYDFFGGGGADSCEVIATFGGALGALVEGDLATSTRELEQTLDLPGTRYPIWGVAGSGGLALARALAGDLTAAIGLAERAIGAARDMGTVEHVSTVLAQLAAATVSLDRGLLLDARRHLDAAGSIVLRSRRHTYRQLHHLLDARLVARTDGPGAGLDRLRELDREGPARPIVEQARTATEIGLLLRAGAVREAVALVPRSPAVSAATRIDVHLACDDPIGARSVLDRWRPEEPTLRTRIERRLREATVLASEGHPGPAGVAVADAAVCAEPEQLLGPFLELPSAVGLLRDAAPARRLRRLRALLDAAPEHTDRGAANARLADPLSTRELTVLEHLPSRLSNAEIADALYVSVNTLKTHVRSVYRKLGVADRDAAVVQARKIGLL